MSFLLDALRKSENQKHLGKTPTIHSSSVLETRTSANRRLGLVLVVLLPVLLVLAWFGLRDLLPGAAPGELEPQTSEITGQQPSESRSEAVEEPGISVLPEIPTAATDNAQLNAARTPVESYSEPPVDTRQPKPSAVLDKRPEAERASPVSLEPNPAEPRPAPATHTQSKPPTALQETAVISYWQLPESVRGQLVAIRISVMVYSEKPDERFIIMNGKRLVEGDEPQQGLVLEEIRRDGAVFSFRLYQFLVTR